MAIRKWLLPKLDTDAAAALAEACEINPFLAILLTTRGIVDPDEAYAFLLGEEMDDPFSFADMDAAVERIGLALDNGERIMVYGDYDVDGITSTALLYSYLKRQGANVQYRLPTREGDGYGLHMGLIDEFAEKDIQLVITVDNGVTAVEEIAYAAQKGIDVVVTDHHQPKEELPAAVAVVDPHRADCQSGCVNYAGVGVAFMLVCALEGDADSVMEEYGDLLALGMLADVMPLVGTTRNLVRRGLAVMNHLRRPGLRALAQLAGLSDKELTATRVVFSIAPRLNAAGRIADPIIAAQLLLEEDAAQAERLAQQVHDCNTARQTAETQILKCIEEDLIAHPEKLADRVLVIEGNDWPAGVIGILAARLTERYGKPSILLSVTDGIARGSGRSIEGFSLFDALCACADDLVTFGGHELAAGLSVLPGNIETFRKKINAYAKETHPQMPVPTLRVDFKLRPAGVDVEKLAMIAAMEPFGAGNPAPVFGLYGMRLDNITPIGNGKHLRLSFSKGETRLNVLKFHTEYQDFPISCGGVFDLAVTLEKNVYKGVVSPTILLKDMRYADTNEDDLLQTAQQFDALMRRETVDSDDLLPSREQMGLMYRYLASKNGFKGTLEQLHHILEQPQFSMLSIRVLIEIWREAGLIAVHDFGEILQITVLPSDGKSDLTQTPMWQHLKE